MYFIEMNHTGGAYYPERNVDELDRASTIKDIRTGEVERVNRIVFVDLVSGVCRDATREIAQAVLDDLDERPHTELRNWLDDVLGAGTADRMVEYMESV